MNIHPCGLALTGAGLTLSYGGDPVVHEVDLSIRSGRVTALVGPNGSGKSTLLRSLARLHRRDAGRVRITGAQEDADLDDLSPRALATRLAMLTQQRPTPAGVTVSEVEPAKFKERKRWTDRHELIRDRIEDLARQLGVPTPG